MKKHVILLMIGIYLVFFNTLVYAKTINEADTEICETLKYALISSLTPTKKSNGFTHCDHCQEPLRPCSGSIHCI